MDTEKIWICKIFMPWNVDTALKTAVDWPSIKVGWSNGIHRMSLKQLLISSYGIKHRVYDKRQVRDSGWEIFKMRNEQLKHLKTIFMDRIGVNLPISVQL